MTNPRFAANLRGASKRHNLNDGVSHSKPRGVLAPQSAKVKAGKNSSHGGWFCFHAGLCPGVSCLGVFWPGVFWAGVFSFAVFGLGSSRPGDSGFSMALLGSFPPGAGRS